MPPHVPSGLVTISTADDELLVAFEKAENNVVVVFEVAVELDAATSDVEFESNELVFSAMLETLDTEGIDVITSFADVVLNVAVVVLDSKTAGETGGDDDVPLDVNFDDAVGKTL